MKRSKWTRTACLCSRKKSLLSTGCPPRTNNNVQRSRSSSTIAAVDTMEFPNDYFSPSTSTSLSSSKDQNHDFYVKLYYHQFFAPILSSPLVPWFNPYRSISLDKSDWLKALKIGHLLSKRRKGKVHDGYYLHRSSSSSSSTSTSSPSSAASISSSSYSFATALPSSFFSTSAYSHTSQDSSEPTSIEAYSYDKDAAGILVALEQIPCYNTPYEQTPLKHQEANSAIDRLIKEVDEVTRYLAKKEARLTNSHANKYGINQVIERAFLIARSYGIGTTKELENLKYDYRRSLENRGSRENNENCNLPFSIINKCHSLIYTCVRSYNLSLDPITRVYLAMLQTNKDALKQQKDSLAYNDSLGKDIWNAFAEFPRYQVRNRRLEVLFDILCDYELTPFTQDDNLKKFLYVISQPTMETVTGKYIYLGYRGVDKYMSRRHWRKKNLGSIISRAVAHPVKFFQSVCSGHETISPKGSISLDSKHQAILSRILIYSFLSRSTCDIAFQLWRLHPLIDIYNTALYSSLYSKLRSSKHDTYCNQMIDILAKINRNADQSYNQDINVAIQNALHCLYVFQRIDQIHDTSDFVLSMDMISNFDIRQLLDLMPIVADTGKMEAVEQIVQIIKQKNPKAWVDGMGPAAYGKLLGAYAAIGDVNGVEKAFDRLIYTERQTPDVISYHQLLRVHAKRLDIRKVFQVWGLMRANGVNPTLECYNELVHLHCLMMDPYRAEKTIKKMESITRYHPDVTMLTTLMRGYLEIGAWDKVIDEFRKMEQSQLPFNRPNLVAHTTLLRAYVNAGAPLMDIMKLFRVITRKYTDRVGPRVYSLILQAACNAKQMDLAEDTFSHIDSDRVKFDPNVFHFTILITGFSRQGKFYKAKAYYDEMVRRQIQPTSITGAAVVRTFARFLIKNDFEQLEKLAQDCLDVARNVKGRNKLFQIDQLRWTGRDTMAVFTPLLNEAIKHLDQELIQKYYQKITSEQDATSLLHLNMLLDACSALNDIDSLWSIWNTIFDHCKSIVSSHMAEIIMSKRVWNQQPLPESSSQISKQHVTLTNIPFSILMDCLIQNGLYDEVENVWDELQGAGFGFDPVNWNRLAVSLAHNNKIGRALWIVEEVLLSDADAPDTEKYIEFATNVQEYPYGDPEEIRSLSNLGSAKLVEGKPNAKMMKPIYAEDDGIVGQVPFSSIDTETQALLEPKEEVQEHGHRINNDGIVKIQPLEDDNDKGALVQQDTDDTDTGMQKGILPEKFTRMETYSQPKLYGSASVNDVMNIFLEQIVSESQNVEDNPTGPLDWTRYIRGTEMWKPFPETLKTLGSVLESIGSSEGRHRGSTYDSLYTRFPKTFAYIRHHAEQARLERNL